MTIDLDLCPFCKKPAEIVVRTDCGVQVRCTSCHCGTPWENDDWSIIKYTENALDRAIAKWNTRVDE